MDDIAKSRNELIAEVSRMHRSRQRIRIAGLELLQEQTRMETLLRGSSDAIVLCDHAGAIQLMSQGAEALFGYEELALRNRPLDALIPCPEEYQGDVPGYLAHLLKGDVDPMRHPLEVFNRRGERLLLSFSLSRVNLDDLLDNPGPDRTGEYQAALCIFHDIGVQKMAFEEMAAHHRNLERLVQEMREELRAAELENPLEQAASHLSDLLLQDLRLPLANILDLAKTAAALDEATKCPNLVQAIEGIRYIAEGLTKRLERPL